MKYFQTLLIKYIYIYIFFVTGGKIFVVNGPQMFGQQKLEVYEVSYPSGELITSFSPHNRASMKLYVGTGRRGGSPSSVIPESSSTQGHHTDWIRS